MGDGDEGRGGAAAGAGAGAGAGAVETQDAKERRGAEGDGAQGDGGEADGDLNLNAEFVEGGWRLCWWRHRHSEFRVPELRALFRSVLQGAGDGAVPPSATSSPPSSSDRELQVLPVDSRTPHSPFCRIREPPACSGAAGAAALREACSRAQLVRGVFRVLATAGSTEGLLDASRRRAELPAFREEFCRDAQRSWRMHVSTFGYSMDRKEQRALIDRFSFLRLPGPVRMKSPDDEFFIIHDGSLAMNRDRKRDRPPAGDGEAGGGSVAGNGRWYFCVGEVFGDGGAEARKATNNMLLTKRKFIGPTSMDTEMAFIMCNHAGVRPGDFVYDPFVGTGSIIVAAARLGAYTFGMDIDMRMLLSKECGAKKKSYDMWDNFDEYGLHHPLGILRGDNSMPPLRACSSGWFDAIVTDPPYGVRAGGRKAGGRRRAEDGTLPYEIPPEYRSQHIASTRGYPIGECYLDLVETAARTLRRGGSLTFFLPCCQGLYDAERDVPTHPALRIVSDAEQLLSSYHCRRLITMVKVAAYDEAAARQHRGEVEANLGARLESHAEELHAQSKKTRSERLQEEGTWGGIRSKLV